VTADNTLGEPPEIPERIRESEEAQLRHYQARLDDWLARRQSENAIALARANLNLEYARQARANEAVLRSAVHDAYLAVSRDSLGRSLQRATFVSAAAGTAGTAYSSFLAVYSTVHKNLASLPARAFLPTFFFGVSLVLGAVYSSFFSGRGQEREILPSGIGGNVDETRLIGFLQWIDDGVRERGWALRLAVAALGLGVASLPVAFIAWSGTVLTLALIAAAVILAAAVSGHPAKIVRRR
jgi:hypothetical protein